ncbi:uncharacterized protein LOC113228287 [Hyposmocoma kahamanoa]|uniref:uncharacterized protein LOC113228287 n=1 Tax=Hyposmocoma kahamanoa TaxID=1477025 RepID=UPI000E6DA3D6|nr:uncharacterized protein LOC113228287 [Hyposmocoma kahamanoa]
MTRVHSCLVDGCSSTSLTSHLCRWPRSVELERVWIDLLKSHSSRLTSTLTHRNRIHRHAYVCHLHFEEKFIKNDHARVPLSWPTLFSEEEISSRRPTRPVTVFRPVGDHSYAVAPWTNVELVPQKRKWAKSHRNLDREKQPSEKTQE